MSIDLLIVVAPARSGVYQGLAPIAAIEPPVWGGLIATYCQNAGFSVAILDAEAEGLREFDTALRICEIRPRLAAFSIYGQQPSASTQCLPAAERVARLVKFYSPAHWTTLRPRLICFGTHPSALPERTLREGPWDYVVQGEGPTTVAALLRGKHFTEHDPGQLGLWMKDFHSWRASNNIDDLDTELPGQAWHLLNMTRYRAHNWHLWSGDLKGGYASVQTSLGCSFRCLRGDTLINTLYGKLQIREIAKRGSIPVYTYDMKTRRPFISDGIQARRYGTNEKLVRVAFTDGTHIDCTPDHQFLTFRWTKTHKGCIETPAEARHLRPGTHIRALRETVNPFNRTVIACGRDHSMFRSRLVMEYIVGRTLARKEQVHHIDHNTMNDLPDNLRLHSSAASHFAEHPEISARMRTRNPMRNENVAARVSATQRANIASGRVVPFLSTKKGRALISKIARERAITDNPMKRPEVARKVGEASRIRMKKLWRNRRAAMRALGREPNHRVLSVTPLEERDDVYCLTVPATGWFFANDVLVKNCSFCCINAPFGNAGMRYWSPRNVVEQIARLVRDYGITNIKIPDEMFTLNPSRVKDICLRLINARLGERLNMWAYARIDTVRDEEMLALMRKAGFRWLGLGIESGSKHVRDGVEKGRFTRDDIVAACGRVRRAGIHVAANYIFGLPDDTQESMQETLDLACYLNTPWANFYCAVAYPGSRLHTETSAAELPEAPGGPGWIGYAQHAREFYPLRTATLSREQIIDFRDDAFMHYFSRPHYRAMLREAFGDVGLQDVDRMLALGRAARNHRGEPK